MTETEKGRAARHTALLLCCTLLAGCIGPPALQKAVIGYDKTTARLDQELLLVNIGRLHSGLPVHFTRTSSIAATFDWSATVGTGADIRTPGRNNVYKFSLGARSAENPTFSIIPISGQDFTKRVLTPFDENLLNFAIFQGEAIDQSLRLMAQGIEVQNTDGTFVRTISNDPEKPGEYEEFRRIAMHLQWLFDNQQLFVRRLVFEEVLFDNFGGVLNSRDVKDGFDKGFRWRQKKNGKFVFSRFTFGRVLITNYDPATLTDRQRFRINEKIKRLPKSFVALDIRPGHPGGDFPVHGAIKLRSMIQVLAFVANGIETYPEYDVDRDPRTGPVAGGPTHTLRINVTEEPPPSGVPSTRYGGKYYSIGDTAWDRRSFTELSYLFQQAVGKVEDVGIPITISK